MPAPGQFIPRKSSAHRIACIALYRALLVQCPKIPLPDGIEWHGTTNPIKHLVRKEFRKNVAVVSSKIVVERLREGYAAHHLLTSAATTQTHNPSLTLLHDHLRTLHATSSHSRAITPPMPRPPPKPAPYPKAQKVLDVRPLPLSQISSGKRHVPTLAYAEYLPFLRFKRPQSPYLSRVIRQKLGKKQKRMDVADELEIMIEEGEWEEGWEESLRRPSGLQKEALRSWEMGLDGGEIGGGKGKGEGSWKEASYVERAVVKRKLHGDVLQAQKLGIRMLEVVDKEKALWVEERRERKRVGERRRRVEKTEWRVIEGLGGIQEKKV